MLLTTLLLAATQLLPGPAPASDTTRLFQGVRNQTFAWGTLVLQDGRRLQAYLPVTATGLYMSVPYYAQPPDEQPAAKPKNVNVNKVRFMRVQGQYSELLTVNKREGGQLAARRQAGAVELFLVQMTLPPLLTTFLGSTPVLGSPATHATGGAITSWYLRRPAAAPILLSPEQFAKQVSSFLSDDKELAAKVAAGAPGYQFDDLESIIQQYNQRARR